MESAQKDGHFVFRTPGSPNFIGGSRLRWRPDDDQVALTPHVTVTATSFSALPSWCRARAWILIWRSVWTSTVVTVTVTVIFPAGTATEAGT